MDYATNPETKKKYDALHASNYGAYCAVFTSDVSEIMYSETLKRLGIDPKTMSTYGDQNSSSQGLSGDQMAMAASAWGDKLQPALQALGMVGNATVHLDGMSEAERANLVREGKIYPGMTFEYRENGRYHTGFIESFNEDLSWNTIEGNSTGGKTGVNVRTVTNPELSDVVQTTSNVYAWLVRMTSLTEEEARQNRKLLDAVNEWYDRKIAHGAWRENTAHMYKGYKDRHIIPYFEKKNPYLKDVTVIDVQHFVDAKAETLNGKTVRKIMVVLNGTFDEAVRFREIPYNPCVSIDLPAIKKFEGKSLTIADAKTLISAIEQSTEPGEAGVMIALLAGLRRSEVAALRWDNIDLVSDMLYVRETKTQFGKVIEVAQTKSASSKRDIAIPLRLHNYLTMLKAEQDHNKQLCGSEWEDNNHVCVWPDGTTPSVQHFNDAHRRGPLRHHGRR